MEQWELERLRKRYEKRLNDTLRMDLIEDNVHDACDSVCQYALWEEFSETLPVSVVDGLGRFLYSWFDEDSWHPDEVILESNFDYYQARNILQNFFPSVPCGVRGIIKTENLIVNPDLKNPDSKAMAGLSAVEGSQSFISLVNSGYLSREDLIRIGSGLSWAKEEAMEKAIQDQFRDLSTKLPLGTEVFSSDISITATRGISITATSLDSLDRFISVEISYGNGKKQDVDLYQLDGYLLNSYLFPALDCVIWTNGLCWKIFYKGQLWEDIVLDPGKAYVETDESGRPLDMPIQIEKREFEKLIGTLKLMYRRLWECRGTNISIGNF